MTPMKNLVLALTLLLSCVPLFAQSTTVSGTITDAGAQTWNSGTYTFTFVPNPQYPTLPQYTWTGGTLQTTISGNLSGTGTYSQSIPSNNAITPIGSSWTLQVCPLASSGCFTVPSVSITGGTQTLNATPPAILINLIGNTTSPIRAYSDSEISGALIGSTYYNTTLTGLRVCSAVTGNACTAWGSTGGGAGTPGTVGGTSFSAAPKMGFYIGPDCPVANTGQCFNTPANGFYDTTCTWSNASTTLTCSDNPFNINMVGEVVEGWSTCQTDLASGSYGSAIAGGTTLFTISTFTDSNHVVLSGTPANTQATSPSCLYVGSLDDTAASALDTAIQAVTTFCPKIFLAAANYSFAIPHFFTQPNGCKNIPGLTGGTSGTFGNLDLPEGFQIEGRGPGNTLIHLVNSFPGTTGCAFVTYNSISSCFAIPPLGEWRDFQITGDGQFNTCGSITASAVNLIYSAVANIDHVLLTNFCGNAASAGHLNTGLMADLFTQMNYFNISGFGDRGIRTTGGGLVYGYRVAVENTPSTAVWADSTFSCHSCVFMGGTSVPVAQQGNNWGVVTVHGTTVYLQDTRIFNCPLSTCSINAGNPAMISVNTAPANVFLDGVSFFNENSATNTNTVGIYDNVGSGSNFYIRNQGGGSNLGANKFFGAPGSATSTTVFDQGGNASSFTAPFFNSGSFGSTTLDAPGRTMLGTCTGVANASVTNSLYGTGPNITATTCAGQTATLGTGVQMTQARHLNSLLCTSTATTVSVACTAQVNGSPSTLTCTMTATTACADVTHDVVVNKGDLVSMKIVTGAAETGANIQMFVWWQ